MIKFVVCIDESGITSKVGYSTYSFTFTLIQNIGQINKRVKYIEEELGVEYIHWSDLSWSRRMVVARAIADLDFSNLVYLVANPIKPDVELLHIFNKFYGDSINNMQFYIDGDKPQKFIKRIKNEINSIGAGHNKVSVLDDKKFAGLRLADFVAGAVRHFYDNSCDDIRSPVYNIIKSKIKIIKI